ncbi:hypothetical protein H0H92_004637 [Tricholoma furcatifolium]|nr:hypothetical protein H0H92_004637 [Tricholoma furcatifolium]
MTPEERSTLSNIGFFAPLAIITIHNLVTHRSLSSNNTKATLGVLIFGFLGATGVLLSAFPFAVGVVGVFTRDIADTPLEGVVKNMNNVVGGPWATLRTCLQFFLPLMNDALIIWRAWSIFSGRRWAKYILASVWIITAASQVLSFAINLFATSLIAYVLRGHLKLIGSLKVQQCLQDKFLVWRVLMLLMDAGFVYCSLQLIVFILEFNPMRGGLTSSSVDKMDTFIKVFNMISIFYPTIVTYFAQGLSSAAGIHEAAISIHQSQEQARDANV